MKEKMKTKILTQLLSLCFSLGFVVNTLADDHTPEQNSAIKAFAFEGIAIGATAAELKAKYSDLDFNKDKSDVAVGMAVWTLWEPKTADSIDFKLFDGKVMEIVVWYQAKTLEKIGGDETIYEKLVAKYGKEDEKHPSAYIWQFFDSNRYVNWCVIKDGSAFLTVTDKEAARKLTAKRKAKAEVGF